MPSPEHSPSVPRGSAASAGSSRRVLDAIERAAGGPPQRARLHAALLAIGSAMQAVRDRQPEATADVAAMLARADDLYQRAHAAARRNDPSVAYGCLQQIERELVIALDDDERWALACLYAEQARERLAGWRAAAAQRLAERALAPVPSRAALQALMQDVHAAAAEDLHRRRLVDAQLPVMLAIAAASVLVLAAWALLGGFDWLSVDTYNVTPGMWMVTGVLFGFFGGVVSMLLRWAGARRGGQGVELGHPRLLVLARPVVGAAAAIPIVLLLQAGLFNLGDLSPAVVLGACFAGGFAERAFVAQIERMVGGGPSGDARRG
jgi:hypothetical protein